MIINTKLQENTGRIIDYYDFNCYDNKKMDEQFIEEKKYMKKGLKILIITLIILVIILGAIYLTVFMLAKQKKVFINKWFVDEKNSNIGVDVSSYQANIDMNKLKEQNIKFIYIKATEGSNMQDDRFAENWENAKKAELLSGAYHFFSYDSEGRRIFYRIRI